MCEVQSKVPNYGKDPWAERLMQVNDCVYCKRVSIVSKHFKLYVCDDCYDKQQAEKKALLEAESRSYELDE